MEPWLSRVVLGWRVLGWWVCWGGECRTWLSASTYSLWITLKEEHHWRIVWQSIFHEKTINNMQKNGAAKSKSQQHHASTYAYLKSTSSRENVSRQGQSECRCRAWSRFQIHIRPQQAQGAQQRSTPLVLSGPASEAHRRLLFDIVLLTPESNLRQCHWPV